MLSTPIGLSKRRCLSVSLLDAVILRPSKKFTTCCLEVHLWSSSLHGTQHDVNRQVTDRCVRSQLLACQEPRLLRCCSGYELGCVCVFRMYAWLRKHAFAMRWHGDFGELWGGGGAFNWLAFQSTSRFYLLQSAVESLTRLSAPLVSTALWRASNSRRAAGASPQKVSFI